MKKLLNITFGAFVALFLLAMAGQIALAAMVSRVENRVEYLLSDVPLEVVTTSGQSLVKGRLSDFPEPPV